MSKESPTHPGPVPFWALWRWPLHWQILLGLLIGVGVGYVIAAIALRSPGELRAVQVAVNGWDFIGLKLIGDLFLNGLKLVVIPLMTSSIVLAVFNLGQRGGFGRVGVRTIVYFLSTSLFAILLGLMLMNFFKPGVTDDGRPLLNAEVVSRFAAEQTVISNKVGDHTAGSFLDIFRAMVPDNPLKAAVEGNLLGLIVVSSFFGFFGARLPAGSVRQVFGDLWTAIYETTFMLTEFILRFAPLGVGALAATAMAENYARLAQEQRFHDLAWAVVSFSLITVGALSIHLFIVLPMLLLVLGRVNPLRHFRAMAPALATAFSTASSNATLPVTLECLERRAGVSNRIAGFVAPLGATVNMDGTALYECVAAMFIVQAFGVELSFAQQAFVVIVALLTSIGVAGVPSASLVAIVLILQSLSSQLAAQGVNIPLETGLPILLVFDRVLDMCRTSVNIFSDTVGAVLVARGEGEKVLTT